MARLDGLSLLALVGCSSLVIVGPACGDDGPVPPLDSDSEGATTTADTTAVADTSTSVGTTEGPQTSSGADESSSSGPPPPLEVEVEVFTYPNQPMVVDLAFSAPDLTVSVEHTVDPGVRTAAIAGAPGETWVRVRGLAPDTMHPLAWSATAPSGSMGEGDVMVETEAALPGFVPGFIIEGSGAGYGGYVLFDLLALDPTAPASLFVIDTDGATRWHIGRSDGVIGPPSVFAGAKQRSDGSLLYLRDYSLFVIDELGVEQLALTSAELGLPGLHHDVIELDNGNFLSMSYTFRDIDYPDIGLTHVAGDLLVEITPDGEIVWEWDSFDHLDPLRRRDGFDDVILDPATLENGMDWTHGNGMIYDPATDTILFSMRHQDWVVQIDHATGDLLWRLGEEGDFALLSGTWQYHQHSPEWQADGTLLLYDNGVANPNLENPLETSRAVRYAIDTDAMTVTQAWEDEAEDFLSIIAGDADRLPDGSILVTDSSIDLHLGPQALYARVREIDEDTSSEPQWSFTTALGSFIYRCTAQSRLPGEAP
jgi:Arylsulfotransferase (ASST)